MGDNYLQNLKSVNYDVIFAGALGSVVANLFHKRTGEKYKCLVINDIDHVIEPALLPTHNHYITLTKTRPKKYDYSVCKIIKILPDDDMLKTDTRIKYKYRYFVYAKYEQQGNDYSYIENLEEALNTQYSLVYSNVRRPFMCSMSKCVNIYNMVFYIPNAPHSGYDNYNFLYQYYQIAPKGKCTVVVQGESFYPFCQQANVYLQDILKHNKIQVVYNTKIIRIDYLRRILQTNVKHRVFNYDYFYCFVPNKIPELFDEAGVDFKLRCKQTLKNKIFPNMFIIGKDIFPTTHSFRAINYQAHIVSINLQNYLENTGQIVQYDGKTQFPIWINNKNYVSFQHKYEGIGKLKEPCLRCEFFNSLQRNLLFRTEVSLYYNLQIYGAPYFLFSPDLETKPFTEPQRVRKKTRKQTKLPNH